MISLFISTATDRIIVAIIKENEVIYNYNDVNSNKLSEIIMPIIDEAFHTTNLKPNDIDRIYVVNGPGSFTGIRVGVTIAKVMAWGLKRPIIPISSLELLASNSVSDKYLVPLIDARRDYVYCAVYNDNLELVQNEKHILLDDLIKNISGLDVQFVSENNFDFEVVKPEYNLLKIINKHLNDPFINPHQVNPNYLKLTEAEENFNKQNDN